MDHRFTTLQHWRIVTTSDIEDNRTTVSDQVQSLDHCNSLRDTRETTVTARGIHDDAAAAAGNGHWQWRPPISQRQWSRTRSGVTVYGVGLSDKEVGGFDPGRGGAAA